MSILWRLYYADESTFDSSMGAPIEVPPFGLICALYPDKNDSAHNVGRIIMHGWNHYYWNRDYREWWGCDYDGMIYRLANRLPFEAYVQGATVATVKYQAIMDRAHKDPDFPRKSARNKIERPRQYEGVKVPGMQRHGP